MLAIANKASELQATHFKYIISLSFLLSLLSILNILPGKTTGQVWHGEEMASPPHNPMAHDGSSNKVPPAIHIDYETQLLRMSSS